IARILTSEPREIVALLEIVAAHPHLAVRLARLLPAATWSAIARMALVSYGVPVGFDEIRVLAPQRPTAAGQVTRPGSDGRARATLQRRLERALERSLIARALTRAGDDLPVTTVSVLAVLETEPALLSAAIHPAVVMRMAAAMIGAKLARSDVD